MSKFADCKKITYSDESKANSCHDCNHAVRGPYYSFRTGFCSQDKCSIRCDSDGQSRSRDRTCSKVDPRSLRQPQCLKQGQPYQVEALDGTARGPLLVLRQILTSFPWRASDRWSIQFWKPEQQPFISWNRLLEVVGSSLPRLCIRMRSRLWLRIRSVQAPESGA